MNTKEFNLMLVENFPNLIEKYNEEVSWQEGDETGSHVVYGDVLTPYLEQCLKENNNSEVKKILEFLEKILSYKIKYSDEVVAVSVLEGTVYEYKDSKILNDNYGPLTIKLIKEMREA